MDREQAQEPALPCLGCSWERGTIPRELAEMDSQQRGKLRAKGEGEELGTNQEPWRAVPNLE